MSQPRLRDAAAEVVAGRATPFGAIAAFFALALAIQWSLPITHDVGWLLVATRHMLRGARVYEDDVIEVSPPMILWLFAPAVAASRATGASEIACLRLWILWMVAGSLALCDALMKRALGARREALRRWALAALAFAMLIPLRRHFGQREHLIAILLAPYVVALGVRSTATHLPSRLAAFCGSLAGLAVALKPHYALVPAILELRNLVQRRSAAFILRPETVALAATAAVYALAIVAFAPGYLYVVLPLARDSYWAYQRSVSALLHPLHLAALAAAFAAAFRLRADSARANLARSWWLAAAAAYLAYLLQQKGWPYHLIVFDTAIVACFALSLVPDPLPRAQSVMRAAPTALFGAVLAAALTLALPVGASEALRTGRVWRRGLSTGMIGSLVRSIRENGSGGPVVFLSTRMEWGFPAVNYAGVDWSLRFSCLWPLAAVIRGQATGEGPPRIRLRELERYVVESLVADFERAPPRLVFVDTREAYGSPGVAVDLIAMLNRHPDFARVWADFEFLRPLGPYGVWLRRELKRPEPADRPLGYGRAGR